MDARRGAAAALVASRCTCGAGNDALRPAPEGRGGVDAVSSLSYASDHDVYIEYFMTKINRTV